MILTLLLEHHRSLQSLPVIFLLKLNDSILAEQSIDLSTDNCHLDLLFDVPVKEFVELELLLTTSSEKIKYHPLTIKKIILDNFYQIKSITYRGKPLFSNEHLDYAASNKMFLDLSVNDSNRLDFTGILHFKFKWPFFREIVVVK
jgi:hypothetical protein